mmetsp:Transcript_15032/g.35475  ORF Transcript_15032/g.35475 Transcript_15032/m.35475 type:complete len:655 (-) Transcript_15032:1504-3468(-)
MPGCRNARAARESSRPPRGGRRASSRRSQGKSGNAGSYPSKGLLLLAERATQRKDRVGRRDANGLEHGLAADGTLDRRGLDLEAFGKLLIGELAQGHGVKVLDHLGVQVGPELMGDAAPAVLAHAVVLAATAGRVEGLVHRDDDVGHRDVFGLAPQRIPTTRAAGALDKLVAAQLAKQLLQIGERNLLPLADGSQRDRARVLAQRQVQHRGDCKPAFGGETHTNSLKRCPDDLSWTNDFGLTRDARTIAERIISDDFTRLIDAVIAPPLGHRRREVLCRDAAGSARCARLAGVVQRDDAVLDPSAKGLLAQLSQLVSQPRGLFELEVAGVFQHLPFELGHALGQILLRQLLDLCRSEQFRVVAARLLRIHAVDQVLDALLHAARRDAVRFVERNLLGPAALGLADGLAHGLSDPVRVQDGLAIQVACGAADGLDQAALGAQEALFVRIQDGDQRHLGDVQPLAQQVDAHQHVEGAKPQVAQDLDALHRVDVRVQITHLDAVVAEVIGQLFGHPLGQRRDEDALVGIDPQADLLQHVVHLVGRRPHLDHGVDETGGPNDLLDHLAGVVLFILGRRGRHKDRLAHLALELRELQRPVVECRRQPEAVLHQRRLARPVAVVHAAELADQHMAFIQKHQRVRRQIVHQRGRRVPGLGA